MSYPRNMSYRDQHAQLLLARHHAKLSRGDPRNLPSPLPPVREGPKDSTVTVGIIGAGAAGLYAALIIDSLKDTRIGYEIFDANSMENRKGGGRLFTYNFSNCPNDYFDVGAMRFPDIGFMKPVFDLIRDNTASPIHGMLDLTRYIYDDPNNLNFYNGTIKTDAEVAQGGTDPFQTGVNPPAKYDQMIDTAIGDFKLKLQNNFIDGWKNLMLFDEYSMRDYLAMVALVQTPDISRRDELINFMETFDSATNLYDCALSESVMDSLDFDYSTDVHWWCIQGGAGLIADKMASVLTKGVERPVRVTAIGLNVDSSGQATSVNVTVANGTSPRTYPHVISTMPLSCLSLVDTTQCVFDWDTQTAIRALHYDASVKVAIKFQTRWWESESLPKGPHRGGSSSTDRPTRTVVYPSCVALRKGHGSDGETYILQTVIKDLADMHGLDYNDLWNLKTDYKIHNWYADEFSVGAFALFGPGNFSNLYKNVTRPIGGIFHFAGEATSAHHAWVLGAFNSAWRAVYEVLVHEGWADLQQKMIANWPIPSEFDIPQLETQVALGQRMKMPK